MEYFIASLPSIPCPSAPAQPRQHLYSEGKFAEILAPGRGLSKDEAGNFAASQEKSDVVHDLLSYLSERMLEMNEEKQKATVAGIGGAGTFDGSLSVRPDCRAPGMSENA